MDSIKYVSRLDDWILTIIDLHFYLVTNKSCVQNHPLRHGLRSSIPEVEQITSSGHVLFLYAMATVATVATVPGQKRIESQGFLGWPSA